jgi:hypothetical protein
MSEIKGENQMSDRVWLSMDGNAGCALLGENIQEGECEFVTIDAVHVKEYGQYRAEKIAINRAFTALKKRLGRETMPYYIAPGHPDHC